MDQLYIAKTDKLCTVKLDCQVPSVPPMTWIRVVPFEEDPALARARAAQQKLYPIEYAAPTHPQLKDHEGIVGSHSLIPDALYHAFAAFGALMAPDLPLTRRQHEMITTVVSAINRCHY
jgi:alkylhydroperoxidase family enzyme